MSDYSVDPGATIERLIAERDAALALIKTHEDAMAHVLERENVLQQRLTAADERADVLEGLLWEYVDRDEVTNEWAREWLSAVTAALKPAEGGGDEYRKSCEAAHKALSMENQRITPVRTETREDAVERLFGRFGDGE